MTPDDIVDEIKIAIAQYECDREGVSTTSSSKELLEMANLEWKNREERKGIHDRVSWTSGWISGYLTRNPQAEREKVLERVNTAERKLLEYFDTGYPSDDSLTIKEIFEELREGGE